MFTLKHLKTLQHVLILFRSSFFTSWLRIAVLSIKQACWAPGSDVTDAPTRLYQHRVTKYTNHHGALTT